MKVLFGVTHEVNQAPRRFLTRLVLKGIADHHSETPVDFNLRLALLGRIDADTFLGDLNSPNF